MGRTAVTLMLCVTIPKDPTIVRAKTVFMEMAQTALVSICKIMFLSGSGLTNVNLRKLQRDI